MKVIQSWVATAIILLLPNFALAADLFSDDFDVNHTANWTVNSGFQDTPGDNSADFFFDYSTVGIPLAPHSAPNAHPRGLKLQANQDLDNDGEQVPMNFPTGLSVSPTGKNFSSAGSYTLRFDLWANYPGPFPLGGVGTTQVSTFGIRTSGSVANYVSAGDAIMFAATNNGAAAADYRVYSPERLISYQLPAATGSPDDLDDLLQPIDNHATYHAGSRNNTAALYANNFPSVSAPSAQLALFPQQTGTTDAGTAGMAWHDVEVASIGNMATWKMDGILLATLDMTHYASSAAPLGGGNIFLGQSDINAAASVDPAHIALLFTLIDNVRVVPEPASLTLWLLAAATVYGLGSRSRPTSIRG